MSAEKTNLGVEDVAAMIGRLTREVVSVRAVGHRTLFMTPNETFDDPRKNGFDVIRLFLKTEDVAQLGRFTFNDEHQFCAQVLEYINGQA